MDHNRLPGREPLTRHPLRLAALGLVLLPFLEGSAFLAVAGWIGLLPALVALVATSFVGAGLLRRLGVGALARLAEAARRGAPLDRPLREGGLLALGCALMIVPGFVTDAVGFALVLPSLMRHGLAPRGPMPGVRRDDVAGRVIDLDSHEWRTVARDPLSGRRG